MCDSLTPYRPQAQYKPHLANHGHDTNFLGPSIRTVKLIVHLLHTPSHNVQITCTTTSYYANSCTIKLQCRTSEQNRSDCSQLVHITNCCVQISCTLQVASHWPMNSSSNTMSFVLPATHIGPRPGTTKRCPNFR